MEHVQDKSPQDQKQKESSSSQLHTLNLDFTQNKVISERQQQLQNEKEFLETCEQSTSSGVQKARRLHLADISQRGLTADAAYEADVDDDFRLARSDVVDVDIALSSTVKSEYLKREREHIFELFQPWALKTYGDQAKTKTITLRKKVRILKALEGKEHSRPDSSKFRFWVKSKGFTTQRPDGFEEIPGRRRRCNPLPPFTALSDNPMDVDLFVGSTIKEISKRTFRKVATVEEFFDIIYNVHMELGGRSGMHAGQKRTYRIITETYAFLPREAVTRFLSICPECKKNLRAFSPAASSHTEDPLNESSSEVEALNYSSQTESSLESGCTAKASASKQQRYSTQDPNTSRAQLAKQFAVEQFQTTVPEKLYSRPHSNPTQSAISSATLLHSVQKSSQPYDQFKQLSSTVSKIRINPCLQRPLTPPITVSHCDPMSSKSSAPTTFNPSKFLDADTLKTQQSLLRYYEYMRRFYAGGLASQLTEQQVQQLQSSASPTSALAMTTPSLKSCGSSSVVSSTATNPISVTDFSKIHQKAITQAVFYGTMSKFHKQEETMLGEPENATALCMEPTAKKFKGSCESPQSQKFEKNVEILPQTSTPKQIQLREINPCKPFIFRSNGTSSSLQSHLEHQKNIETGKLQQTSTIVSETRLLLTPSTSMSVPSIAVPYIESTEVSTLQRAQQSPELRIPQLRSARTTESSLGPLDLEKLKPITSTYLQLTRSMGLSDEDALRFDNLETLPAAPTAPDAATTNSGDANTDSDPYAGLIKDADKLKLMLLAWNYQNSNAVRNGTEGPDLSVVGGLWAQYQNALAQNAAVAAASGVKLDASLSPVPRTDANSPMEGQDETNSSGQKEEDEGSEDDSDDKLDEKLATHDPERLKAFNMFVRLFVDENLDRIVPISKQPKEKIQAIIDSCARQFPEFSDRSRKRIRTYLKSCRRNKKTRDGWDNTTRPTPAHLTSVQAEQILAIACENESMNAKRMRIGLEPITHAIPAPGSAVAAAAAAAVLAVTNPTVGTSVIGAGSGSSSSTATSATIGGGSDGTVVTSSTLPFATVNTTGNFARSTPNSDTVEPLSLTPAGAVSASVAAPSNASGGINSARSSPLALSSNASGSTSGLDIKPLTTALSNGSGSGANVVTATNGAAGIAGTGTSPLYRPTDFTSPSVALPFATSAGASGRGAPAFPGYFPGMAGLVNATPTDLSMKAATSISASNSNSSISTTVSASTMNNCNLLGSNSSLLAGLNASVNTNSNNNALITATQQLQQLQQQQLQQQNNAVGLGLTSGTSSLGSVSSHDSSIRPPPLLGHKLSQNEITAARQVISAYRESAAFLLRTADQVEQLLVQQQ